MADSNGATGSVGTPAKKPKAAANPGGGTGSVGAPVSPIGTAAKKAKPTVGSIVADPTGRPSGGFGAVQKGWPSSPTVNEGPMTTGSAASAAPGLTSDEQDVYSSIAGVLGQAGLSSLWQTVWNKSLQGEGNDQIMFELEQSPEFKARFPGMTQLQAQGQTPPSVGEYLAYESTVRQQAETYGIDPSHVSQQAIGDLIGGNVSAAEATQRLQTYYQAAQQIDPAARDYLAKNYGITTGNLMDIFMNPDQHLATLQAKVNASTVGGAATQTGWGDLDANYAMRLAQAGETQQQALTSFGKLAGLGQLTQNLGDNTGSITKGDELSAEFDNNAAAQQKLANVAAGRVAAFQGGGSFSTSSTGVSGLKSANT